MQIWVKRAEVQVGDTIVEVGRDEPGTLPPLATVQVVTERLADGFKVNCDDNRGHVRWAKRPEITHFKVERAGATLDVETHKVKPAAQPPALIDGWTKEQCYDALVSCMREQPVSMTSAQKAVARGMWSAFLKIRAAEAAKADAARQVTVLVEVDDV